MIIYLDIIFLENLLMNYIILLATTTIMRQKANFIRIGISSAIGSIYAILVYLAISEVFSNVMLQVVLSVLMVFVAFTPRSMKALFKQLMFFYLTSFTFGGATFALLYFIRAQGILFQNDISVGTAHLTILLAGGAVGFLFITLAFKNIKGRLSKSDILCELKITMENNSVYVKAIIDTGNFLKEPLTGIPVIVVEKQELYGIIEKKVLDNLYQIVNGEELQISEYKTKIRIIPFTSLGKSNGILMGIKVDSVIINSEDKKMYVDDVIVGVYEGKLSKNDKYKALIGLEILEERKGGRDEYIRVVKV